MGRTFGVRRGALLVGLVAMTSVLSGCVLPFVNPPTGAAPLRYRDPIFADVGVARDLQYGSAPDLVTSQPVALKLDLYQPTGDTVAQRPAIVEVHGGSFAGGDKGDEASITTPMAQRGFVAVAINYRLNAAAACNSGTITPACSVAATAGINDAQAAVRWLRANAATYRIDPDRIAIEGVSAGAIIATGVALNSEQVGDSGNPGYSSKVQAFLSVSGGLPGGLGADASDPPGYFFHGTADTTVPYQWSVDTSNALSNAGVFAVLYTEPGVGHTMPDLTLLATQTANFYYWEMDLAHALR